jgi:hypothetical protein
MARPEPADGTVGEPNEPAICLRTTARTGTAVPTGTIEQAACWSRGPQRGRHNRLPSLRHRQQHGTGVSGQLERHETPDPGRSNAVNSGFQCVREASERRPAAFRRRSGAFGRRLGAFGRRSAGVRQAFGSGPIFMINISQTGIELVRPERGIHAVWTATWG